MSFSFNHQQRRGLGLSGDNGLHLCLQGYQPFRHGRFVVHTWARSSG